jgi:hypothetical protein
LHQEGGDFVLMAKERGKREEHTKKILSQSLLMIVLMVIWRENTNKRRRGERMGESCYQSTCRAAPE